MRATNLVLSPWQSIRTWLPAEPFCSHIGAGCNGAIAGTDEAADGAAAKVCEVKGAVASFSRKHMGIIGDYELKSIDPWALQWAPQLRLHRRGAQDVCARAAAGLTDA